MLEHHHKCSHLLLLVFVKNDDWLVVVGHFFSHYRFCVLWHDNSAEKFLYLLLYIVNVNISDNNYALVVWTIPCLIIVS